MAPGLGSKQRADRKIAVGLDRRTLRTGTLADRSPGHSLGGGFSKNSRSIFFVLGGGCGLLGALRCP